MERIPLRESNAKIEDSIKKPPINYIDVVIDPEYLQENLMLDGGLQMPGGEAGWNGEVYLMRYSASPDLTPDQFNMVEYKIAKFNAEVERTYKHESHHIQNRENGLTPHIAANSLREFMAFRVLDELSAFTAGELLHQEVNVESVLSALQTSKQKIITLYYGETFNSDKNWYVLKHKDDTDVFRREINSDTYHKVMKQYFYIDGNNILEILKRENKIPEFTEIVNDLILRLDTLLSNPISK